MRRPKLDRPAWIVLASIGVVLLFATCIFRYVLWEDFNAMARAEEEYRTAHPDHERSLRWPPRGLIPGRE